MTSAKPPEVAAIVVTYNSEHHITALLDSLPAALGPLRCQTVVVDNGSTDNTLAVVQSRDDCVVVPSTNRGYAAGLNEGVRHSGSSDYILVLNPDATLGPRAVPAMIAAVQQPRVGVASPMILEEDGELSLSLRREPTLCRVGGLSFTHRPRFSEIVYERSAYLNRHLVDWAMGAVMLVSRTCWDALGGFDESFFLYSEETDFCLRARDHGWLTVYTPHAKAMHVGGGSGESADTHVMKMVNRVRVFGRRNGPFKTCAYFAMAVLTEIRRGILGHRASWQAARALLQPSRRPRELNCSDRLIPA